MAKDPALLWYPADWISGTQGMTFEEKGAYMELLMMQFNRGHMTTRMIGQVVGQLWDNIKDKFIQDENGLWFNKRLELEQQLRKNYIASRINNKTGRNQHTKKRSYDQPYEQELTSTMTGHMVNENINVNTNTNISSNKTKRKKEPSIISPDVLEIVGYLNAVCGTAYRPETEDTQKHINKRLNSGFTVAQFKDVIDKKFAEWGNDPYWSKYLRPDTLFGTKFEIYVNQPNTTYTRPLTIEERNRELFNKWQREDLEHDQARDGQDTGGNVLKLYAADDG